MRSSTGAVGVKGLAQGHLNGGAPQSPGCGYRHGQENRCVQGSLSLYEKASSAWMNWTKSDDGGIRQCPDLGGQSGAVVHTWTRFRLRSLAVSTGSAFKKVVSGFGYYAKKKTAHISDTTFRLVQLSLPLLAETSQAQNTSGVELVPVLEGLLMKKELFPLHSFLHGVGWWQMHYFTTAEALLSKTPIPSAVLRGGRHSRPRRTWSVAEESWSPSASYWDDPRPEQDQTGTRPEPDQNKTRARPEPVHSQ
ncbi:hypothetical protein EYF80_029373 [Liparis tanakae]|uniref:Uncharacterized protein n=1 Tax=Liparis tanakae TaxID=230148 RepID=A0A4Z2H6G7_9TELE|nr:hypothetical protein EYF80_029373 [Liparis tanakae]